MTERRQTRREQAALRRLATLVAEGVQPADLFAVVAEEVGRVVNVAYAGVARYEPDGTATACASFSPLGPVFPVGTRRSLEGTNVLGLVRGRSGPARIDDYAGLAGEIADVVRRSGIRSSVGTPIVVAGRLWGAMLASGTERLPGGTEARLADFTELLATAIANAESHTALAELAEEQAVLRRVATLVAGGVPPDEIFSAVCEEVGHLLGADLTAMHVFPGDGTATMIAGWSAAGPTLPIGTRLPLDGDSLAARIFHTGAPGRMDGYGDADGEIAEIARALSIRSTVGAPIKVGGRLWGALMAATRSEEMGPAEAESRIAAFTELVATAISNAQARDDLLRLADEQAALRRVATLVARDVPQPELFGAIADELRRLLGTQEVRILRFDRDRSAVVVGSAGSREAFPLGSRQVLDGDTVASRVLRTGRTARIDDYGMTAGPLATVASSIGIHSVVGAPVLVRGRLWGVVTTGSTHGEALPRDTESRLSQFTELMATAIANAEAREAVARLAGEQAALRRVATQVAQGAPPIEVFSAVGDEAGRLLGTELAAVARFDHDGRALELSRPMQMYERWELADFLASAEVLRTGRPARAHAASWEGARGGTAERLRSLGVVSMVACPIVVEGELWGMLVVASTDEPLPPDTEERLEKFTELVATAIANTESTSELAASRRRIVAAADEARRRIERDLHDGIQQRLVALTFRARALSRRPAGELPGMTAELADGLDAAAPSCARSRAAFTRRSCPRRAWGPHFRRSDVVPAFRSKPMSGLTRGCRCRSRWPPTTSRPRRSPTSPSTRMQTRVELVAAHDDGLLTLEVRDDGVGGVDAGRGSGIVGIKDRVEALGGTISIASPPGGGTTLSLRLPIAPDAPATAPPASASTG